VASGGRAIVAVRLKSSRSAICPAIVAVGAAPDTRPEGRANSPAAYSVFAGSATAGAVLDGLIVVANDE
jgi:hypothetical protein